MRHHRHIKPRAKAQIRKAPTTGGSTNKSHKCKSVTVKNVQDLHNARISQHHQEEQDSYGMTKEKIKQVLSSGDAAKKE